ncbi:NAD-dependent epimerase/dehydratase family protein [Magnetospirillum sulfuroxidans]|uniref:NAD-dependent epimerase/dehydratase family protein n=1 Tax=Magnetospirillum sulfuroxidans TaxID=611300 RepID=A0ABS5IED1_9PROT|nr:NAD-dependent epimerase/dehydratase family protein [Magnetospirillum sulfuroxidans]MBR9972782.1 NAD-dependent epimerase/dehydratase family protein [Magnetospirillum sulfuroxidans]
MKILVTGASGFVGSRLVAELLRRGHQVVAPMRRPRPWAGVDTLPIGDLGPDTDWLATLSGCDAVVHSAARAHVLDDRSADPLAVFRRVNRDGTLHLAKQAHQAGVKYFLFISTIKVNGESTPPDCPFRAEDAANPQDAYGIAKAEAEAGLRTLDGLALTVLRPPLVHGPGAKGNLAVLIKAVARGMPLPLGLVRNRRSMVGVDNLADAVAFLLDHRPAGRFLIRDDGDLSTAELVRTLAAALGRSPRLLPVPPVLLALAAHLLGRRAMVERVLESLVVDDTPLRALGWTPPLSLQAGLARMVRDDR